MAHPLHVLTPLTGKEAAEKRTVIIGGFEINARLGMVLAVLSAPALLLTLMTVPFLEVYSVLVFPFLLGVGAFAFHMRSADGMRLRMYQSFRDRYKAEDVETFYMCGQEIALDEHFEDVYGASYPISAEALTAVNSIDDLFIVASAAAPAPAPSRALFAVNDDDFAAIAQRRDEAAETAQETWHKATVGGHPVDVDDYSDIFAPTKGTRRK